MTFGLDVGGPQSCCFPGLACYHVSPVQRLPGSTITFITSDFTPSLKHEHSVRFSFSLLGIIHSERAERPQNVRRRAWLPLQGTRPSRWPLKIKTTLCPMFRFTAVFVYYGFWYLRCLGRWRSTAGRQKGHVTICDDVVKKLGEKTGKNVGMSVPKAASVLTVALHWSIGPRACDGLTPAPASPPSLPGTPCAPGCSPGSEPSPGCRWPGATSERPGRCSRRTHLSPGSQRSARTREQEAEKQ